ncbi:hypothetical protein LCGC14_2471780, partial [marine sediment metagenome]
NYMTPIFAIAAGAAVLAEPITRQILAGFVLIVTGLVISQANRPGRRPVKPLRTPDPSPALAETP